MKRFLLLSVVLFALAGCSKDETTDSGPRAEQKTAFVPHFYGLAMLENPAPETRGVANKMKLWSRSMAEEELTVKFLNGTPEYRKYVKDVAVEWMKVAGVRFIFVNDNQEAMIRIGFDYVRGMQTSWSYTGTDNMQLYDLQDEPTMHFAQWRRISDEKKRSDVLRAFGQVLGLELEYRHPDFDPGWITKEDGTINVDEIRLYWEDELAEFISWDELKKMVLDPINVNARFIAKTTNYDPNSVMNWPFFYEIAERLKPIEYDSDYKTELSEQDKSFIKTHYGESLGNRPIETMFFPLIEIEYTGSYANITVTATKELGVYWDNDVTNEYTQYKLPTDTTSVYTFDIEYSYETEKTRKIVIGEILEYGQAIPSESYAITKFDLWDGADATSFDIKKLNHALTYVQIQGSDYSVPREFKFNGYNNLKELYLRFIKDSKVILENCPNLEVFATSEKIWKPEESASTQSNPVQQFNTDLPGYELPTHEIWPMYPELIHSLSDTGGELTISNCPKLKILSLEHTRQTSFDFSGLPALEYVYLSSFNEHLVGAGIPAGTKLYNAIKTLPTKGSNNKGTILLRGIKQKINVPAGRMVPYLPIMIYTPINIDRGIYNSINQRITSKNWNIIWESGVSY